MITQVAPPANLLTVETIIILVCVIAIAYSLGWLTSHGFRRIGRWLDARERDKQERAEQNRKS